MATAKLLGASIKRREDPRFITGKGNYTDDLKLAGMTHAVFVRSPHANAKIRKIDTSKASKVPGVVAIFTGKDMAGVNSLPCGWLLPELKIPPHMPLATDAARYVGDPVAVVIGESQSAASDGADAVEVGWEVLPSVTNTEKAAAKGSPQIHEVAPNNVAFTWQIGDAAATDAAFKSAAVTVKKRIVNQRLVANPMEPRACVARYDEATGDWTLWVTSQNPHVHRLLMTAFVLGIPEHKVRVIAPDVGGGFGSKIFLYNEETVCTWASRQVKRPIRWTSSRREAFQTDAHGRDHVTDAEVAVARDGKLLGLRVKTTANLGAYLSTFAPAVPTYLYATLLNGVYEWPAIHAQVTGVFTNTTPVDAYRGAGRPEACYLLERMIDAAAAALKMDPAEVRKKNFIPKFDNGYQTKVALQYDSGNYGAAFDKLLAMLDYKKFRREQADARARDSEAKDKAKDKATEEETIKRGDDLLKKFPPEEWSEKRMKDILQREIVSGIFRNAEEREFIDNFKAWQAADARRRETEGLPPASEENREEDRDAPVKKPAYRKPVEKLPVETRPAEKSPPGEAKPLEEPKPEEKKPEGGY